MPDIASLRRMQSMNGYKHKTKTMPEIDNLKRAQCPNCHGHKTKPMPDIVKKASPLHQDSIMRELSPCNKLYLKDREAVDILRSHAMPSISSLLLHNFQHYKSMRNCNFKSNICMTRLLQHEWKTKNITGFISNGNIWSNKSLNHAT